MILKDLILLIFGRKLLKKENNRAEVLIGCEATGYYGSLG